jgi:mercuric ion transport protein
MNVAAQLQNVPNNRQRACAGRSGFAALVAGGLAALLASACCLGPLLLVVLGISGAWIGTLTRLEPYRPYVLGLAIVSLCFAARRIIRPAGACRPDAICSLPRTRSTYKILFGAAVLLLLIAVAFPYAAKYFY